MSYIAKNGRLYTSGASEALTLLDDKFSVNKSYSKGDSCIYNDYLWKFTSDKPAGEWDSSVVEQCRIMDFVDDINGRLTQLIQKKTIAVNITNGVDYVQTGLTENDIPVSAELVGYTAGALLRVDFGFIRHNHTTLLKFNNASGSAIGNKDVILYYITIE